MSTTEMVTIDGNQGAATIAHQVSEVIAIYPITPSPNMGELADEFSATASSRTSPNSTPT